MYCAATLLSTFNHRIGAAGELIFLLPTLLYVDNFTDLSIVFYTKKYIHIASVRRYQERQCVQGAALHRVSVGLIGRKILQPSLLAWLRD